MRKVFPAAKGIIINNKGKFLIIKEDNTWELPGGKIEFGESPEETLHREVKEETNLEISDVKYAGVWWKFIDAQTEIVCVTFFAKVKHQEVDLSQNPSDEIITEYQWVTKEEFLTADYPVIHQSLKELIANHLINPSFFKSNKKI